MEEELEPSKKYSFGQKAAAWGVHAFTASGIVAGFFGIVAASQGNFFIAFAMLFATVIIDGIDGTFARRFKVKEVLPDVSGKTMDYIIDFATYAIIPTFIIYQSDLLPAELDYLAAAIILLVSTLYYGKEGMVSNDMYFIGFPVMWNLVAFYLYYVVNLPPMGNFILVLIFAILHFVPIKYLYPSQTKKFMKSNILASVVLLISNFALLVMVEWEYNLPTELIIARLLSVASLLYFGALSVYHTWFDVDTQSS